LRASRLGRQPVGAAGPVARSSSSSARRRRPPWRRRGVDGDVAPRRSRGGRRGTCAWRSRERTTPPSSWRSGSPSAPSTTSLAWRSCSAGRRPTARRPSEPTLSPPPRVGERKGRDRISRDQIRACWVAIGKPAGELAPRAALGILEVGWGAEDRRSREALDMARAARRCGRGWGPRRRRGRV